MPDLGLLKKSKVDERLYMLARRHSDSLSSTLEQRLRISSALMLNFFYPPCTSREKWVRTTTSFKLAIENFSIRKTLSSDHFDKLAFSLNKKFANDVIFLHADTLTGCPLDPNNIIKFRAYRRNLLLSAPYVTRNLSGDKNGLFVVDEDFFIVCTRHACARLHSIIFCSPGFSLHTHLL